MPQNFAQEPEGQLITIIWPRRKVSPDGPFVEVGKASPHGAKLLADILKFPGVDFEWPVELKGKRTPKSGLQRPNHGRQCGWCGTTDITRFSGRSRICLACQEARAGAGLGDSG